MTRKYSLYQVDAFTKEKFTGNAAGVVTNATGLTADEMQKIARELNNSETAFLFPANDRDHDIQIRFFSPTNEVPICGHATIASHYVRAVEKNLQTARVFQKTGAGILPVDIIKENDDYKIIMTQGKIEFGEILAGKKKESLLASLNLKENELLENFPLQIVSTGNAKVMIGVKNRGVLHALEPNYDALVKLSSIIGCNGFYVFTTDSPDNDIFVHGRMFAPASGVKEDPVTGNANGPLGAYLVQHQLVSHNHSCFTFKAKQGEAINRAGIIEVEVKINHDEPVEVKISGNAVIVYKTELILEEPSGNGEEVRTS
ncbi:PhzF family isomerase [Bacillaceae bacterium Marseille-Q3522]|nr:PhzF family isomerase [Bacillaceae bacterium Marseille-Q3522]